MLRRIAAHLRARLAEEGGWSLVVVMGVLLATSLLSIGAWSAANGDIQLSGGDADNKAAYSAAESALNYYLFHLNQDAQYWTNCTNVPGPATGQPAPINQAWNGVGNDPRTWRLLPGSTNAKYTIELLPANGYSQCDVNNPTQSMIDTSQGTFRIRATGRVNGKTRSIVATFRRKNFLDFLYFTDFETIDPIVYQLTDPSQQAALSALCSQYRRNGRPDSSCSPIVFASADQIAGPFHTNDDIVTCGTPTFGRTAADPIEISGPAPGWNGGGCSGSPNFVGTLKTSAPVLALPPTNANLKTVPNSAVYTGATTIRLNSGGTMNVTNAAAGLNNAVRSIPSSGVIYVQNGTCGTSYTLYQNYSDPAGCANLSVSGTTSTSVTLASENDVIVTGNLISTGAAEIGIIPNNFARVYHPVTNRSGNSCTNGTGTPGSIEIDAAILALQHSFIVDNYYCGAALGTLTVKGAIAQRFRGPVGTGGSTISTGYIKSYTYDDRLKVSMPPYFLSPVVSAWGISRFTEQIPATG